MKLILLLTLTIFTFQKSFSQTEHLEDIIPMNYMLRDKNGKIKSINAEYYSFKKGKGINGKINFKKESLKYRDRTILVNEKGLITQYELFNERNNPNLNSKVSRLNHSLVKKFDYLYSYGKIIQILTNSSMQYEQNYKPEENEKNSSIHLEYDNNFNLIYCYLPSEKEKEIFYELNENGVLSRKTVMQNGVLFQETIFEFNSQNKLMKKTFNWHHDDGELNKSTVTLFDSTESEIQKIVTIDNEVVLTEDYVYDNNKNLVESIKVSTKSNEHIYYSYDKKGRCIERENYSINSEENTRYLSSKNIWEYNNLDLEETHIICRYSKEGEILSKREFYFKYDHNKNRVEEYIVYNNKPLHLLKTEYEYWY